MGTIWTFRPTTSRLRAFDMLTWRAKLILARPCLDFMLQNKKNTDPGDGLTRIAANHQCGPRPPLTPAIRMMRDIADHDEILKLAGFCIEAAKQTEHYSIRLCHEAADCGQHTKLACEIRLLYVKDDGERVDPTQLFARGWLDSRLEDFGDADFDESGYKILDTLAQLQIRSHIGAGRFDF